MNYVQWECSNAVAVTIDQKSDFEELDTKFTATVLVNVCEPSEAYKFLDDFFAQTESASKVHSKPDL